MRVIMNKSKQPYTYIIGWPSKNVFYYGVRYSSKITEGELGTCYLSSSKYVRQFIEQHGLPEIVGLRRYFLNKEEALNWESRVLTRMKVVSDDRFLNRWDNNMVPLNHDNPPFKNPIIQEKANISLIKKYGGRGSGSIVIKDKVENTNMLKYGTKHTLHLDVVKNARVAGSLDKYGTTNPFYSKEFQDQQTNPMHDPVIRQKHKSKMESMDWTARNVKTKQTNLKKYGTTNPLHRPDVKAKRYSTKCKCPCECDDQKTYYKSGFQTHMARKHQWKKERINEFYERNCQESSN